MSFTKQPTHLRPKSDWRSLQKKSYGSGPVSNEFAFCEVLREKDPARISTNYKSLYPTDSGNQEIAIRRLASHRDDGSKGGSGRKHPDQLVKDVRHRRSEKTTCPN